MLTAFKYIFLLFLFFLSELKGYDTFFGYYNAMTEDYWEHTHSVATNCDGVFRDLHDSTAAGGLRPGTDNGTYEATLFGDRAVDIILNHSSSIAAVDAGTAVEPFFMYLAFHNEHDPHQAPLSALQSDGVAAIKTDVYKVTAALIETMDAQIGRVLVRNNITALLYIYLKYIYIFI